MHHRQLTTVSLQANWFGKRRFGAGIWDLQRVGYLTLLSVLLSANAAFAAGCAEWGDFVPSGAHIVSYAISPDGREMTAVELGDAAGARRERIIIIKLPCQTSVQKTAFVGDGIGPVYWLSNRKILFAEAKKQSEVIIENVHTGTRGVIFRSRHDISIAAFDRKRGLVAYDYLVPWRWKQRVSVRVTDAMSVQELIAPVWARASRCTVIGAIDIDGLRHGARVRRIWLRKRKIAAPFPPTLAWRSGQLLAFVSAMHEWRTRIVNLESGHRVEKDMPLFRIYDVGVSGSGGMAVLAGKLWKNRVGQRCGCGEGPVDVFTVSRRGEVKRVSAARRNTTFWDLGGFWWAGADRLFVQAIGYKGRGGALRWWLEEVNVKTDKLLRTYYWPGGDLGDDAHACSFDAARDRAICIGQSLTDPPVLVDVNLSTGRMRVLGKVNPAQHRLDFKFRKVRIPTRFGYPTTGFLATPKVGRRHSVPLAVMAYGFSEAYSQDAQWITSYPVSEFVHAGIAVLMVNWARTGASHAGLTRFATTRRALASAISVFSNAVPAVREAGVRVSRAIVMGWSFGGLYAAHAIQSLREYVAAQVGDPAAYNVMQYGLSNAFWRNISAWYFGGPPVGRYLDNYRYMDPAGDGKPAHGPILFEFVSRNPDAGQYLEEWRAVGTEVEAFAYRRSVHWLSVPAEARISRLRNLYWAKLNLFGPQSVTRAELSSVGLTVPARGWWNAKPSSSSSRVVVVPSGGRTTFEPTLLQPNMPRVGRVAEH